MGDSAVEISQDVALVGRIEAVPTILRALCELTGLRFAAVARVTDGSWVACAVQDDINFGLLPGGALDVHSTLCKEVRAARSPIAINHASQDATYCHHHTPRTYQIESYISVPILLPDGGYFGNLCAIDPLPSKVAEPRIVATFQHFADMIGSQLEAERRRVVVEQALLGERHNAQLREQLLAILGHHLRDTIGAMALSSHTLRARAHEPASVLPLAAELGAGAKRASALLTHALSLARGEHAGEARELTIDPQPIERLDEALFGVITEVQQSHPGREISWQFDIARPVRLDRARIQQLAANLLDNALTHGDPTGPVRLDARLQDDRLQLSVWNRGEPIPPDLQAQLFAPIWRRQTATQREGLGLGLHVCQQIASAHGGQLALASSLESGTCFTASLPA